MTISETESAPSYSPFDRESHAETINAMYQTRRLRPRRRLGHLAAACAAVWLTLGGLSAALWAVELQGQTAPLVVTVGKSLVLDNAMNIQRISLANGDLAEAVAVNPREVLINGKAPGETSLIIWQQGGPRLLFDLAVAQHHQAGRRPRATCAR